MALELIRGIAAGWVVLHHLAQRITPDGHRLLAGVLALLQQTGELPVMVFFVLSGFVIAYRHLDRPDPFRAYLLARFTRIYPVFISAIVCGGLFLLLASLRAHQTGAPALYFVPEVSRDLAGADRWPSLLGTLCMVQGPTWLKLNGCVSPFGYDGPLWSLSFEWWFYLAFWGLYHRLGLERSRGTVQACSLAAALALPFLPQFLVLWVVLFATWWAGVDLAADYRRSHCCSWQRQGRFLLGALTVDVYYCALRYGLHRTDHSALTSFVAFCLLFAALAVCAAILSGRHIGTKRFDNSSWVTRAGADSYALYAFHYVMINIASLLPWGILVDLGAGILASLVSADLVERHLQPLAVRALRHRSAL